MSTGIQHQKFQYPITEKIILGIAACFIGLFFLLYFSNASFRHFFFNTADEELYSVPIGKVSQLQGNLTRQRAADTEFNKIVVGSELFPNDTVMTGSDTGAVLELQNGQKIQMAANSLVKLAFDFDFSLGSLIPKQFQDAAPIKIEAVAGAAPKILDGSEKPVIIPPAPPKPKETPLALLDLSPPNNSTIEFSVDEVKAASKQVTFSFKTNKTAGPFKINVYTNLEPDAEPVLTVPVLSETDMFTTQIEIKRGSTHRWTVIDTNSGKLIQDSRFNVNNMLTAIETLPTEGANNRISGQVTKSVFDGFTLRWKAFESGTPYVITVYDFQTKKPVQKFKTSGESLTFSKGTLTDKRFYYIVEQDLKSGFKISSKPSAFKFEFLTPVQVSPANGLRQSIDALPGLQKKVFFTWAKTHYTREYEFELSGTQDFSDSVLRKIVKDNFYVVTSPKAGVYYWRIRSISEKATSNYSNVYKLELVP